MYDIYLNSKDDKWRFALGKSGNRILHVIGLNPSTATKEKSDTTISKVNYVATKLGFDGFVMLNLYPVRATDWRELSLEAEKDALEENYEVIENFISSSTSPEIWTAWGEDIKGRQYFNQSCLEIIARLESFNTSFSHYGAITKGGHPRHPSRLSYKWGMSPFDIKTYKALLTPKQI